MNNYNPYKIINPYICGNIFEQYKKLEKEYTVAKLKLEIFSMEFLTNKKEEKWVKNQNY